MDKTYQSIFDHRHQVNSMLLLLNDMKDSFWTAELHVPMKQISEITSQLEALEESLVSEWELFIRN